MMAFAFRNGRVRPGDTVAVVRAGPIGLAAIAVRLFVPVRIVVDLTAWRLEAAGRLGADADEVPEQPVADVTDGLGADVVIEAVGVPESFELCTRPLCCAWRRRAGCPRHSWSPTPSLVTHIFPPDRMEEAYDVFARATDTGTLKVVLGEPSHDEVAARAA